MSPTIDLSSYKPVQGTGSDANLFDNAFDALQTLLNGSLDKNNLAAAAGILASQLAGYPNDVSKVLRGDGSWGPGGGLVKVYDSVDAGVVLPAASFDVDLTDHQDGKALVVDLDVESNAGAQDTLKLQLNGVTANSYYSHNITTASTNGQAATTLVSGATNSLIIGTPNAVPGTPQGAGNSMQARLFFPNYASAARRPKVNGNWVEFQSGSLFGGTTHGALDAVAAVTSLHFFLGSGQISAGRISVYKEV